MTFKFKGRDVECEGHLEVGEGYEVTAATWIDTGEALDPDECQAFESECQSELYQEAYEWAASDAYDRAKDR